MYHPSRTISVMQARILVVEDNKVMRQALGQYLEDQPDLTMVAATETAEEALEYLDRSGVPDLVLADTRLPGMSGIDLVRRLQSIQPDLPCLMYSGHDETRYVEEALDAGAKGYLIKGDPDQLSKAIEQVLAGNEYIDEKLINLLE